MLPKEKISIAIPVFNEEECLEELLRRLENIGDGDG